MHLGETLLCSAQAQRQLQTSLEAHGRYIHSLIQPALLPHSLAEQPSALDALQQEPLRPDHRPLGQLHDVGGLLEPGGGSMQAPLQAGLQGSSSVTRMSIPPRPRTASPHPGVLQLSRSCTASVWMGSVATSHVPQRREAPGGPVGKRLRSNLSGAWSTLSRGCLQAAASTASPQSNGRVTGSSWDLQGLPALAAPRNTWRVTGWNPFADLACDDSPGTPLILLYPKKPLNPKP